MIPKFRAWDKTHKKLGLIDADMNDGYFQSVKIFDEDEDDWQESENFILMQFTGLKDKNGTEIFEGDLLSCDGGMPHIVKFGQWICEDDLGYKIRNIGFYIDSSYDNTEWFQGIDYENTPIKFEIIGNIYENQELLEVKE
ncbi:YopX family protein [Streptococcus anginosus]|uniref:YopX protein domain-containing protein n=1 Tax=Streptococcus anginosus TaxID=1328 RepID=A0A6G4N098_STRAP|nr:YopX family protein [Streptococcus anginosus]MCW0988459.1 YopX family protein [Streptococcus anginosus]NGG16706.1 hypothetical protein [Streptococcus anginosus]NGG24033.1 hypothetical protein [Streptococcus anginosus]